MIAREMQAKIKNQLTKKTRYIVLKHLCGDVQLLNFFYEWNSVSQCFSYVAKADTQVRGRAHDRL